MKKSGQKNVIHSPSLIEIGKAIAGKDGLNTSNVKYPFPAWTAMFPGSDSKNKCDTLGEALVCLLDFILY